VVEYAREKMAGRAPPTSPQRDIRRWIYGGLDVVFAIVYVVTIWKAIPNRLLSAQIHLWILPISTAVMAGGTLAGGRRGWQIALGGGSLLVLATIALIVRMLASAAFLAGTYGAFGGAAAASALVGVALVVELVGLLPIVQVKYLMSRAGRRAYGVG